MKMSIFLVEFLFLMASPRDESLFPLVLHIWNQIGVEAPVLDQPWVPFQYSNINAPQPDAEVSHLRAVCDLS